jgi:Ca2+-binding EF-hand superfamily protein
MSEELILAFNTRTKFSEMLKESFTMFDKESSGMIEKDYLKEVLANFSDKFDIAHPPEETAKKFADDLSSSNTEGKIKYDDMEEYLWKLFH